MNTLHVIEYFAKSLKIIRNDNVKLGVSPYSIETMYLVLLLRHAASKNGATLKREPREVGVVQGH